MNAREAAYERRMLVLREAARIQAVPYADGAIRAYHVVFFHGAASLCHGRWGPELAKVDADLRRLAKDGYLDKVAPAEYRVNTVGLAMVELLERGAEG